MSFDSQYNNKRKELDYLKNITILTENMKIQLDHLAIQVKEMHNNAEVVARIMKNWDSIMRSISQASLALLQYTENDYEVGLWSNKNKSNHVSDESMKPSLDEDHPPLPETLIRISINPEEK